MNKIILLSLLMAVFGFSIKAQTGWKNYDFKAYQFEIDFFEEPGFSMDTTLFNDSSLVTYLWKSKIRDTLHSNNYYSIGLTTYPSKFIHSDSALNLVEGFINSTQNSLIDDSTYTSLSSTLIEKNGYPGKAFRWKSKEGNIFFEFHVFLVENRLFELSVVSRQGENHNIYIDKFFNSFEFNDIPKGKFVLPQSSNKRTISVKFPMTPEAQTKILDSEYGKLTVDLQMLELKSLSDNRVYMAMETEYPNKIIDENNPDEVSAYYKKSIDGAINSVNGTLVSVNDIYYNGKPGKEFRCSISEGKILMVYRVFYINHRAYSLGVLTLPNNDKNKAMMKFFDSFEIKN